MRPIAPILVLISMLAKAQSDVYPALPYQRLLNKFNQILENNIASKGEISLTDKFVLEEIKRDMLEDCKAGRLREYTGREKYDFQNYAGIPTRVYEVRLSEEATGDIYRWVLPWVECNGPGPDMRENTPKPTSNFYSALPYDRLLNKFNQILVNVKADNGIISLTDKMTLEELKKDMVEDCKEGKLQEYTGSQKYGITNTQGIPTKVYHVRLSVEPSQDTYYWALPEVDCNGLDGRVNYESDDESDSERAQGGQQKIRAKLSLAGNDEFGAYIRHEHQRFDGENKKDKVSLRGVPKPPHGRLAHV